MRIELDVAKLAGLEPPGTKRQWSSIVLAALIGLSLGYLTFKLDEDGFDWWSVLPGVAAGLMVISIVGMLFPEEEQHAEDTQQSGNATGR